MAKSGAESERDFRKRANFPLSLKPSSLLVSCIRMSAIFFDFTGTLY